MIYFANIKNGAMLRAQEALIIDGVVVEHPTTEQFLAAGYKPVTFTDEPDAPDGYHAEFYWIEEAEKIIQAWQIVEDTDEVDADEALNILLGGDPE